MSKTPSETQIHHLFPTIVHIENIPRTAEVNQHYIDKSIELANTLPKDNINSWRCDTFSTLDKYDMINDPIFVELIEDVKKEVAVVATFFGAKTDNIIVTSGWINVAGPGAFQEYHIHTNSHFSVVYYLKTPKNCGNLVFKSFEAETDMFPLPLTMTNYTSYKTFSIPATEGHMVVFRSNISHMVEKNMSNDSRISISMNINLL